MTDAAEVVMREGVAAVEPDYLPAVATARTAALVEPAADVA